MEPGDGLVEVYFPEAEGRLEKELRTLIPPSVRLVTGKELPEPARFELLVAGRPSEEQLEASPRLRALIVPFAGIRSERRGPGAGVLSPGSTHRGRPLPARARERVRVAGERIALPKGVHFTIMAS